MNHLNSIYQRLQSNYSDCDITYAPGLLTVKCKNGEIRADGFRTCFLEDGKTVQELLEKTMMISMKKWNDLSFICRKAEQIWTQSHFRQNQKNRRKMLYPIQ